MSTDGIVQVLMAIGIVAVAVIAAWYQNWSVTNMCVAGGFALLRGLTLREVKGEKASSPDPAKSGV